MEQIIKNLISDLTCQRDALVIKLKKLNENTPQYITKETNLRAMVYDIDNQIQMHLNLLNNFLNQPK